MRLQHGGRVVNGVGADPDIVVASAKAYLVGVEQAAQQDRAGRRPGLSRRRRASEEAIRGFGLTLGNNAQVFDLARFYWLP